MLKKVLLPYYYSIIILFKSYTQAFLLPGSYYCGHSAGVITGICLCDGIGCSKMTSGWIYKLRTLTGFMNLTSQLLVTPGIPLWSKPLPSVALAEFEVWEMLQ